MTEGLPRLESCLWPEADGGRGLVRAILEAVTAGALSDVDALDAFLRGTLMAQQVRSVAVGSDRPFRLSALWSPCLDIT
jgi:hypothetical protein